MSAVDTAPAPPKNPRTRKIVGGCAAAVIGLVVFSELSLFDHAPTASEMCTDRRVVDIVKNLINKNTLNAGEFTNMLRDLEATRTGSAPSSAADKARVTKNEILVVGGPVPLEMDPQMHRASCQLTYKVKGLGYDNPVFQLTVPTATYTVQPDGQDWLINLL